MKSFSVWLRKELNEILHTWRIWVLPGLLFVAAFTSPILAWVTPDLLKNAASDAPGVVIELPEPVAADAIRQWGQSLVQIVLFAIVISTAGIVSGERRQGTASLMLSKPLSRDTFILGKFTAQAALTLVSTVIASGFCGIATWLVFDEVPTLDLAAATAVWLLLGITFLAMMILFSVALPSQAASAGAGIVVYFTLSIVSLSTFAQNNTTAGLFNIVDALASGERPDFLRPVLVTITLIGILLALAILIFRRQSITGKYGQT